MTSELRAVSARLATRIDDLIRAVLGHEASMASVDRDGRFAVRPGGDGNDPPSAFLFAFEVSTWRTSLSPCSRLSSRPDGVW